MGIYCRAPLLCIILNLNIITIQTLWFLRHANQGASIIKRFDIEIAAKPAAEAGLAAINGEK